MRTLTSLLSLTMVASLAVACGGGDDGVSVPDASTIDAAPPVDAPPALMGLGQACTVTNGMSDCPTDLACLTSGGANTGYCTGLCVPELSFQTDDMMPPQIVDGSIMPPDLLNGAGDGICTALYTQPEGTAACVTIANLADSGMVPHPGGEFKPNETYTGLAVCSIICGTGGAACPAGLTCNTTDPNLQLCEP